MSRECGMRITSVLAGNRVTKHTSAGFTLVEMAVAMMIVGIFLAGAGHMYTLYMKNKAMTKTQQAISNVTEALSAFKNVHGRYPCPAPLKELRTSASYGHEVDCSGAPPAAAGATLPVNAAAFLPLPFSFPTYRGGVPIRYISSPTPLTAAFTSALAHATTSGVGVDVATTTASYISWYSSTAGGGCMDYDAGWGWRFLICEEDTLNGALTTFNATVAGTGTPGDPARALVAGQCLNGGTDPVDGICIEQSTRTDLGAAPRVRVGGIPFRDMQMEEDDVIDGYGSRLVYAVTERLANASTFRSGEGGIEIRDGAGNILSGGETSASFVVISHGPNKNGAIEAQGTVLPCVNGATVLDGQNCRDFALATDTSAIYVMDAYASGTNTFDDSVNYFADMEDQLWRRFDPLSENIVDLSENFVGIGMTSAAALTDNLTISQSTVNNVPDPTIARGLAVTNSKSTTGTAATVESFHGGALRVGRFSAGAHSGKILTNQICLENDPSKCFRPDRIAGAYDGNPTAGTRGMGCPAGQYMVGIADGRAICSPVRVSCPPGQAMTGTDAAGMPTCAIPTASCPDEIVNLCGTSYTLLAIGHGGTRRVNYTVGGACAYADYACNVGTWNLTARFGEETLSGTVCTYASASAPTGSTSGLSCGAGYSGTYTTGFKYLCDGTTTNTSSSFATDCTCSGITDNVFCDPSFGGGVIGTKEKHCTAGVLDAGYSVFTGADTLSYPSEAALTAALCSCGKSPNWRFAVCPAGKVRKATPVDPVPAASQPAFPGWPVDADQGGYYFQSVDMVSCTYSDGPTDYSNCECDPRTQWLETAPACPACERMSTPTRTRQTNSGAGCSWIDDPDTSSNTLGTCVAKTFTWKSTGVQVGRPRPLSDGRGGNPECGSVCTCAQSGRRGTCASSDGTRWTFYKSRCSE